MSVSPKRFGDLLTDALYRIKYHRKKTLTALQDELGLALGKTGKFAIEYWRRGNIPSLQNDIKELAKELFNLGGLNCEQLEQFLISADYIGVEKLLTELCPPQDKKASTLHHFPPEISPFVIGVPINRPRQFFGREDILSTIFRMLRRSPLQNTAIIGPRQSGKTSVLKYLKIIITATQAELRQGQRSNWLPEAEYYQWVFIDFENEEMCRKETLLGYLLTNLNMPLPEPCNMINFMESIRRHLKRPTIILMDEIGAGLTSSELNLQFWGGMRSLVSHQTNGNLAIILTSHKELDEFPSETGWESPFFTIFHRLTLGPLTDEEATELIASSPQPFALADSQWILNTSNRWPNLLQILCDIRLAALESGRTNDDWKEEGLRQIERFKYLFKK